MACDLLCNSLRGGLDRSKGHLAHGVAPLGAQQLPSPLLHMAAAPAGAWGWHTARCTLLCSSCLQEGTQRPKKQRIRVVKLLPNRANAAIMLFLLGRDLQNTKRLSLEVCELLARPCLAGLWQTAGLHAT